MQKLSNARSWLALLGVSATCFMACIDFTIVNTALPAIKVGLNASMNELQWIINLFILALSAFMVTTGRLADTYGRKRMLFVGMIGFGAASLLAGISENIASLLIARFIQGVTCAALYTASGGIISDTFPPARHGRAMGVFFGISFTGMALGPVVGGVLVAFLGWRWIFFVNIPLTIICLIICGKYVKPSILSSQIRQPIDFLGMILLISGLMSLVLVLTQANIWGWLTLPTATLFFISFILLGIFCRFEYSTKNPIVKFQFFLNKSFFISSISTFFIAFFYCLALFLMPLYLELIYKNEVLYIGISLLPTTITLAITSIIVGKYVDRLGPYKPLLLGFLLFVLSAILQSNLSTSSSMIHISLAFASMGVAWGMTTAPTTTLAVSALPKEDSGLAVGTCWTLHNIGGVLGLGLGLMVYHTISLHFHSFVSGYHAAMALLIISSLFALISISILHFVPSNRTNRIITQHNRQAGNRPC